MAKAKRERGEDHALPDPGKYDELTCGICDTKMSVKRDAFGPTSFAAAMAGKGRKHDTFSCPYREDDWHVQAKKLLHEIQATPSSRIAEIMLAEFYQIIQERKVTKKISIF
jgi:hypothetical protein